VDDPEKFAHDDHERLHFFEWVLFPRCIVIMQGLELFRVRNDAHSHLIEHRLRKYWVTI